MSIPLINAWRAAGQSALDIIVRPFHGSGRTKPFTFDEIVFRWIGGISGPISGTATPNASIAVAITGEFFYTRADRFGNWSMTVSASGLGKHQVIGFQVTRAGIHPGVSGYVRALGYWVLATGFWDDEGVWDDSAICDF